MGGSTKKLMRVFVDPLNLFGIFDDEKPEPPAPVTTPTPEAKAAEIDESSRKAALDLAEQERKKKGRASTILTGSEGILAPAPTQRKVAMGE